MKKVFFIVVIAGLQVLTGNAQMLTGNAQMVDHVVVISIDGFRPDFYLDPSWNATHLRWLMQGGAHAKGVNSVFPSVTYPSHTTIITGVQPAKHGVYYNGVFQPTGNTGKIYWNDSSIKMPTLWGAATAKGLSVASIFWPVSAEAPAKYLIPDVGDFPDSIQEKYTLPRGFVDELKKNVFNGTDKIEYGKDQNVTRIASYVIRKERPNLITIHLFSADDAEHQQGRDGSQVRAAVEDLDSCVGAVIDVLHQAGIWEKTLLIIAGDHGFMDVTRVLSPNVWLASAGLIGNVKTNDWKAQFFSSGGSSFLYLKDPSDKKTLDKVIKMLSALPEEDKKLFRIIDRAKLEGIGGNPGVALALSADNGASFNNALTGEAVAPGQGGTHGFYPDFPGIRTGFIAYGPGIKKGGEISIMNLRDIAPVIAKYLGLSFPTAEGRIPVGLLAE